MMTYCTATWLIGAYATSGQGYTTPREFGERWAAVALAPVLVPVGAISLVLQGLKIF